MAELQRKASAWRQLITLYNQNNIASRIEYRKSNSTAILSEINNVKANITTLPRNTRKVRITNTLNRPELYQQLRQINPNTTLSYRRSTISTINKEIFRAIRNRNRDITHAIISRKLTKFLKNPVNNAKYIATSQELLNNVNNINIHGRFLIEMHFIANGNDNYKLLTNTQQIKDMLDKVNQGYAITHQNVQGSDADEILDLIQYGGTVELTWFNRDEYHKTNTGAYFKWFHKFQTWDEDAKKYELKLDLSRYQVYGKNQKIDYESCLVYSLIQLGVSDEKINQLRLNVFEKDVSFRNLALVSKQLDLQIILTYHDERKKQKRVRIYNKESPNLIRLGVVDEHYFINEMTNITASAITYFHQTKNETIYPRVYLKSYRHKIQMCNKYLTSYEVIRNIYNQREKWLEPISIANVNDYEHVEKLGSYDKLRAPRRACTCNAIQANEEVDLSMIENDLVRLENMPHIYDGGKRPPLCVCNKQRFDEYRDYSRKIHKPIFKGIFKNVHKDPNNNYDVIFLDLETFFKASRGYHVPYCVGYQFIGDNEKYCVYGLNSIVEFLNSLNRNAVIITHNLAFDFRGFIDYLNKFQTPIETGTKLKHIQCKYKSNYLVFKDNCAFLPFQLSALPKMFKLKSGDKDVYPYEFINDNNIESFIDIQEINNFSGYRKPFDSKAFHENCLKSNSIIKQVNLDGSVTELVDIKKYTIHYCNQDVSILKQAYLKFREQILEITKIDIMTLISLPQLADDYFKTVGCYDGCYSISGVAQDFIRKCAIGGRVMTCKNEKWHIKHNSQDETCKRVSDFDAVSLYPSAMKRLDGYLKGLPKVLTDDECLSFNENNFDYYFVEIEIISVGIKRDFPLVSIKNKSGIRDFTNSLEGNIFHVDKTTLQDLVKFQHITYRVIKGYKFTDGFNSKIVDIIENMFNERIKLKNMIMPDGSKGNPLQQAYKLILNASYGKLIQKPIKKTKKFLEGDYRDYVIKNAKLIDSYQRINDKLILLTMKKSIIQHYTACHLACQVLSMSKRIMNEVMVLAEDNEIKIFYQDTDSMMLYDKNVKSLGELFKVEYGRELIGEDMGQFHTDFEVSDDDRDNSYPITATESLFLAKKTYISKLEYRTRAGEIKYGFHVRAKGIPASVIRELDENVMNTYMRLFNNESIEFDLSKACCLKMGKDYRVRNTLKFSRIMHCPNDIKNVI